MAEDRVGGRGLEDVIEEPAALNDLGDHPTTSILRDHPVRRVPDDDVVVL